MKEQIYGRTLPIVLPSRLTRSITDVSLEYRDAVQNLGQGFEKKVLGPFSHLTVFFSKVTLERLKSHDWPGVHFVRGPVPQSTFESDLCLQVGCSH